MNYETPAVERRDLSSHEKNDRLLNAMPIAQVFEHALHRMGYEIHQITASKGFWEAGVDRNKAEMIALMHSELSECLEAVRLITHEQKRGPMDDKLPQHPAVAVELADTIIRILDFAYGFGFDVATAVTDKVKYNATRKYKHGKQL